MTAASGKERWPVPNAWTWVRAAEIADVVGGGTPPSGVAANFDPLGVPWITPADLTGYGATYIKRGARSLSEEGFTASSARKMPKGTVLFSSRAPIGYCVIAENEIATNQGFKNFVVSKAITSEYLRHYLLASKDYAESLASGTTFKELSGSRTAELSIPLAPEGEQRRIAAKIDSLSAKSKRARERLDHVPKLVERYRAAILGAAYRGDTTAAWRAEQRLPRPETKPLSDLVTELRYGTAQKCRPAAIGTAVLRIPNVSSGSINLGDLKYAELEMREHAKLRLEAGDILVIRSNESANLVGQAAIVSDEAIGMAYAGYLIRLRPDRSVVHPKFLALMLGAPQVREVIKVGARSTSGVHNVNSSELAELVLPAPSIAEQQVAISRIERAFARIDRLATEATSARKLLDRLDRAVLAKAFRGELVPQDPDDEPASALLERIRSEKAGVEGSVRRRGRPRAATLL